MLTAKDIMTSKVITVQPDTPVRELARILADNKISGAPVVENERVIGVVTENDLIDQTKKVHIPTVITLLDSVIYLENPERFEKEMRKMAGVKVEDIFTKKLVSVKADTPLDELATIMADQKVHTLPVIEDNQLLGVIGKSDIIRSIIT